jgi:hypothetical protein
MDAAVVDHETRVPVASVAGKDEGPHHRVRDPHRPHTQRDPAQTLTFQAASASWQASKVTWNNQPGVTGSTATTVLGALADGAEFTADITALVQAIANGTVTHYGWRVITSVSPPAQKFAQFDTGTDAWTLTVQFSEDPEPPSALAPDGTVRGCPEACRHVRFQ